MGPLTRRHFLAGMSAAAALPAFGAEPLIRRTWSARWISVPGAPPSDYGVYHFRKTFELPGRPGNSCIHVSGDNRYQLFVNGVRVVWGPARGDLFHWRYETVDIAGLLQAGKNVLASVVWNFGELAPEAQIYLQTGFLLQGEEDAARLVDTGTSWSCERDEAYSPVAVTSGQLHGYYAAGPCDRVDASKHSWGWQAADFDDSLWKKAVVVGAAAGREMSNSPSRWMLVERPIPLMSEKEESKGVVRRATGIASPQNIAGTTIPRDTHATLLIDQTHLTTGYPELTVSGGKDTVIKLRYAETLVRNAGGGHGLQKGNRNEIEGKELIGYNDEFITDGGAHRSFGPCGGAPGAISNSISKPRTSRW